MAKIYFFITCCILALSDSSTSTNIECNYRIYNGFSVLNTIYICDVNTNPNIKTQESAQISSADGTHETYKTNDDVIAFYVLDKTIQFFPKNMETIFKNIKAFLIHRCQLKAVRQVDLKPYIHLVYIFLFGNDVEVLEEGLFDFNPNLEVIGFYESKIIHIDPNVFDHLTKLRYFWFEHVSCIKDDARDSEKVKAVIQKVKVQCVASEFTSLQEQIKNLEIESKSSNFDDFKSKLENFEKGFKNSKLSEYRPLKNKFEDLKALKIDGSVTLASKPIIPVTEQPELKSEHESCSKNPILEDKSVSLMVDGLKDISLKFDDLKLTQCGTKDYFDELKDSQNNFKSSFDEQKSLQSEVKSTLSKVESKLNDHGAELNGMKSDTKNALNDLKLTQQTLKASQDTLSSSQLILVDSLSNLTTKFNELKSSQNDATNLQYDVKGSISDIESTLSTVKTFQNEVKNSLIKIKTTQNEMKISLDELKMSKNDDFEDKLTTIEEKLGKLENLEGHFMELKSENAEKFEKIEKEIVNSRHKLSINFDGKIKESEKRIMKKFEDVLEEKLGKILDEKLRNVIDARLGSE